MVQPGSAIAVSAGTTTHALARHLVDIPRLTVVTNSVWVADVLHRSGVNRESVLLTGGLRTPSDALVGPDRDRRPAVAAPRRRLHGRARHGRPGRASARPNLLEAETNRAMVAAGRRLIVIADSTKWGVVGLSSMARLSEASTVVTDVGLSDTARRILAEEVDEVVLTEPVPREITDMPLG